MTHADRIRASASPLAPRPAGETPILPVIAGVEAVVFDIYGTLIISGAGDISLADGTSSEQAMAEALAVAGLSAERASRSAESAAEDYQRLVAGQQAALSASGVEFPEVEIREVWRELLAQHGLADPSPARVEEVAVAYECAANPVWPMPGLAETFAGLKARGLRLGIVSNAQFYTPHLFPAFLGKSLEELGFDPELMVFSYQLGEGKPSRRLYAELKERGLDPRRTLYVGNDRLKDIWPAGEEGFRTVLFAGDQRSLRWRRDDPRLECVAPEAVITGLGQVLELLG